MGTCAAYRARPGGTAWRVLGAQGSGWMHERAGRAGSGDPGS